MSSKYQVIKVESLPGSPQANSVYYVKASGDAEVKAYISDSDGTAFPLNGSGGTQSVKHISAGIMTTASNNSYQSIFSTGSNILSNALKLIDVSKRKIYDVININVVFVNKTTNSDKLGILRFQINSGTQYFLEVFRFNSDPYSGNFSIKIIYLGSNNYSIIGNAYTSAGTPTDALSSFLYTQSITTDTDLEIKIDFSSSIAASDNYGGNTDIYHEIDYKSSDDSIFLEEPV
jgi:hypothetical protein